MQHAMRRNVSIATAAVAILISSAGTTMLAQVGVGTWVQQSINGGPGALTMTVEACCNGGRRLIYRAINSADVMITVESPFDGTDVPMKAAGRQASGGTMGIKRIDDHHYVTALKMNGTPYGSSRATLSPDGKTLTVEMEVTSTVGGQPVGKQKEVWILK